MHHKGFQFYNVAIYTEKEMKPCQWTCFSLQNLQTNLLKISSLSGSRFYHGSSYQMKAQSFFLTFKVLKKRPLPYLCLTYFSLFPGRRKTANFIENLLCSKYCLTFTYIFLFDYTYFIDVKIQMKFQRARVTCLKSQSQQEKARSIETKVA